MREVNPEEWRQAKELAVAAVGLSGSQREKLLEESAVGELVQEVAKEILAQFDRIEEDSFESMGELQIQGLNASSAIRRRALQGRLEGLLRPGEGLGNPGGAVGAPEQGLEPTAIARREVRSGELLAKLSAHSPADSRYLVKGELERGGMGTIFEVWDQDLCRTVAKKVQRAQGDQGCDSLGRFLDEAQITGGLEHPGIIPVHELGLDESGHVFFTMRLVRRGQTLGKVLDQVDAGENGWSRARALGVLLKVCEAVSYAHSKGVVHRDLKPDNVMVGQFGEVYVIDWGLAAAKGRTEERGRFGKAEYPLSSDGAAAEPRERTVEGAVLGTPMYMPPEQARGENRRVGPASDVYAMGAMLYRLLAGRPPYLARGEEPDAISVIQRVMTGPPEPVESISPGSPPELVAICERSMAREPSERYADMAELAAELQAFLENRVVRAYRTGAFAEFGKWVGRNRQLAISMAASFVLVLGLTSASSIMLGAKNIELKRANKELDEFSRELEAKTAEAQQSELLATRERDKAKEIAGFQLERLRRIDVHRVGSDIRAGLAEKVRDAGRWRTAEENDGRALELAELLDGADFAGLAIDILEGHIFDPALDAIEDGFTEQPLIRADLYEAVSITLRNVGLVEAAVGPHRQALRIKVEELGPEHPEALKSAAVGASIALARGELETAQIEIERVLGIQRDTLGEENLDTIESMTVLAATLQARGDHARAKEQKERVLELRSNLQGASHPETLVALDNLAVTLREMGQLQRAMEMSVEVLGAMLAVFGEEYPNTLVAMGNLASSLDSLGYSEEARAYEEKRLEITRRMLGEEHPHTLVAMDNLAVTLQRLGALEEAVKLQGQALEIAKRTLGKEHLDTLILSSNLASTLASLGRLDEALRRQEATVEAMRRVLGVDHPRTLGAMNSLGAILFELNDLERAYEVEGEVVERRRRVLGEEHPDSLALRRRVALALLAQERFDDGVSVLERSLALSRRTFGHSHAETRTSMRDLASVLRARGQYEEARGLLEELVDVGRRSLGDLHSDVINAMDSLAETLYALDEFGAGVEVDEEIVALQDV